MQSNEQMVWLITGTHKTCRCILTSPISLNPIGASSGLGLALVKRVLVRGDLAIATARDPTRFATLFPTADLTRLHALRLDINSPLAELRQTMDAAIARWGRVDVLVNNAGALEAAGQSEEVGYVAPLHPAS
jgi:NAD(P)-dependent dehydrogenase (short-subunit alcohol dehydrogenase family)